MCLHYKMWNQCFCLINVAYFITATKCVDKSVNKRLKHPDATVSLDDNSFLFRLYLFITGKVYAPNRMSEGGELKLTKLLFAIMLLKASRVCFGPLWKIKISLDLKMSINSIHSKCHLKLLTRKNKTIWGREGSGERDESVAVIASVAAVVVALVAWGCLLKSVLSSHLQ